MIAATWSKRDFDLIQTLCCRVRVLSLEQICRGWWPNEKDATVVEGHMDRLVHADLIQSDIWNVVIAPSDNSPLFVWHPGCPDPDFEHLTRLVRNRWPRKPILVHAYVASAKAARLFGSSAGRIPSSHHRSHDLLLAGTYVHYRINHPNEAYRWLGEDALPVAEKGIKNPDAFLLDANGYPCRIIESAGRYSQDQLEAFHQYCQETRLPYELW